MKKLIILSAIVLSGLVYNNANAQERVNASFRYDHDDHRNARYENREHREYNQPVYYRAHADDRFRANDHFYPNYRHDADFQHRDRR